MNRTGLPTIALLAAMLAAACADEHAFMEKDVRNDPIVDAAFRGDSAEVWRLLDEEKDTPAEQRLHVRSRDTAGQTALHKAAWAGNAAIARMLIERGAEVDARDVNGQTPLSLAARWGNGAVGRLLIAQGADIRSRDEHGRTLLHYAAQYDHVELMRWLVEGGLDPNVEANNGDTPLHSAAFMARHAASRFLLERKADPNHKGGLGWTPLFVASGIQPRDGPDPSYVTLLLDAGADPKLQADSGITPLALAAGAGDTTIAELLIARGASVKPTQAKHEAQWFSPIRTAVDAHDVAMVRTLLRHGADANEPYRTNDPETMLHRAAMLDSVGIALVLLDAGARVDATDKTGLTPLHVAVQNEHLAIVDLLLARGAPVNARDRHGRAPLHLAATKRSVPLVERLLAAGADPAMKDGSGDVPTKLAWGPEGAEVRAVLETVGTAAQKR